MTQEAILDKENFIREMKQNLKDRKEGKNTVMKNSLNINTKEKKKYFYPKETSNFNKAILNSKLSSNKFISKQISIENLISDQNKDKNRSDYSQNKDKRGLIYNNEVDEYTNNYEHGKKITLNNYNSDSYVNWIGKEEKNSIKINGRNAKVLTDNEENMFHYQTSNSINKNKHLKLNTSINNSKEKIKTNVSKFTLNKKDPLTSRNSIINSDKKNGSNLKNNEYIIKSTYIKTDEKNVSNTDENYNFKYYRGKSTNVPRSLMFDKKKVFNSNRKKLYDNLQNNFNKFNQSAEKNYRISTQNSSNNNNSLHTHNTQNSVNYNSVKTNSKNVKESNNNSFNNSPYRKGNYEENSECLNYSLRKSNINKYPIVTNNSDSENIKGNYYVNMRKNKTRNNSFVKKEDSKQTKSYQNQMENINLKKGKNIISSNNSKKGENFIIDTKGNMDKLIEKIDKIQYINKKTSSNNTNIIGNIESSKINSNDKNIIYSNTNRINNELISDKKSKNNIQNEFDHDFKKIENNVKKENPVSKEKMIKRNTKTLLNNVKDNSKTINNGKFIFYRLF